MQSFPLLHEELRMKNGHLVLLSAGHVFADLNQGALPAILPFLMTQGNLNYASAAGLVFAANCASSIVQPLVGYLADRHPHPWLMALGVALSGICMGCIGFLDSYWALFLAVSLSGIGNSIFHPEGARMASRLAGARKGAGLSIFAVGGNIGFALGPIVATSSLLLLGMKGTAVLALLGTGMGLLLLVQNRRILHRSENAFLAAGTASVSAGASPNEWKPFSWLAALVFCRSVIFFGLNTFVPLYWIRVFNESEAAGGTALTMLFVLGAIGTLTGGRIADRIGYIRIIRIGFAILIPLLFLFISFDAKLPAMFVLCAIGFVVCAPFSSIVVLGQKYLPRLIGLASGVTMGLAVSVGGVMSPLLGWIADHRGLHTAMFIIACLSIVAALCTLTLRTPRVDRMKEESATAD